MDFVRSDLMLGLGEISVARLEEERVGSGFHLDYPKQKAQCQFLDEGRSELESFRRELVGRSVGTSPSLGIGGIEKPFT